MPIAVLLHVVEPQSVELRVVELPSVSVAALPMDCPLPCHTAYPFDQTEPLEPVPYQTDLVRPYSDYPFQDVLFLPYHHHSRHILAVVRQLHLHKMAVLDADCCHIVHLRHIRHLVVVRPFGYHCYFAFAYFSTAS